MTLATDLDQLAIDTIRTLSIDAVQKANSGHPGAPMGAAPMAYVLWTRFLRHAPTHPDWPDRDRFVLSAGHASMLLYSLLHLTGYGVSLEDLEFRVGTVMQRELGIVKNQLRRNGVEVIEGTARFQDAHAIEVRCAS